MVLKSGGAKGSRTPDLLNAIQAFNHTPIIRRASRGRRAEWNGALSGKGRCDGADDGTVCLEQENCSDFRMTCMHEAGSGGAIHPFPPDSCRGIRVVGYSSEMPVGLSAR